MAVLHMSEAELVKDIAAVLAQVRQGVEVVVEQDHRPVAVIKSPVTTGRKISDVIAALEASGANAVIDEDFARDVEEGVNAHQPSSLSDDERNDALRGLTAYFASIDEQRQPATSEETDALIDEALRLTRPNYRAIR